MDFYEKTVDIELIELDPILQCRASYLQDQELIEEYKDVIKSGVKLPPLKVIIVDGAYKLVDGFKRHLAYTQLARPRVVIAVKEATYRDAIRAACGANKEHGQRRKAEDVQKAVLLAEATFGGNAEEIGKIVGIHERTVRRYWKGKKPEPAVAQTARRRSASPTKVADANRGVVTAPPEVDRKNVKPCEVCGCEFAVLTDAGYSCEKCSHIPGEKLAGTVESVRAVHTATGRFVRDIEKAGMLPAFEDLIDPIIKRIAKLIKGNGGH